MNTYKVTVTPPAAPRYTLTIFAATKEAALDRARLLASDPLGAASYKVREATTREYRATYRGSDA